MRRSRVLLAASLGVAAATAAWAWTRPSWPPTTLWVVESRGYLAGGLPGHWFPVPVDRTALSAGGPALSGIALLDCDFDVPDRPRLGDRPLGGRIAILRAEFDPAPARSAPRTWLAAVRGDAPPAADTVYRRTGRTEILDGVVWHEFALR